MNNTAATAPLEVRLAAREAARTAEGLVLIRLSRTAQADWTDAELALWRRMGFR